MLSDAPATFPCCSCRFLLSVLLARRGHDAMPPKSLTRSQPQKSSTTSVAGYRVKRGVALPMGAILRRRGVNFAIFSKHATSCTLVLFQPGAEQPFVEFPLDSRSNRTRPGRHAPPAGRD